MKQQKPYEQMSKTEKFYYTRRINKAREADRQWTVKARKWREATQGIGSIAKQEE